jgi:hypothetical protein
MKETDGLTVDVDFKGLELKDFRRAVIRFLLVNFVILLFRYALHKFWSGGLAYSAAWRSCFSVSDRGSGWHSRLLGLLGPFRFLGRVLQEYFLAETGVVISVGFVGST